MSEIVTGDDSVIPVELTKDGLSFIIDPGATVLATVTNKTNKATLIPVTAVLESAPGSDWENSLIMVGFSSEQTSAVTSTGNCLLEIQVDDGGTQTWFADINIVKGTI